MKRSKYSEERSPMPSAKRRAGRPWATSAGSSGSARRRSTCGRRNSRTWASASCVGCGSSKRRTRDSRASSPISRSTSTSCRRPSEKTGRTSEATGARSVDPRDVSGLRDARLSPGWLFASRMVQTQSCEGSAGAPPPDPRTRGRGSAINAFTCCFAAKDGW